MPEMMPAVTDDELYASVTLTIRPECRLEYLNELRRVLPQARALPGCRLLEVGEHIDAPATFILTERWRSGLEYLNEYLTLPFFQDYLSATEPMYAAPLSAVVLRPVAAERLGPDY
ncbi:putative quinol monooxygenase [Mycobacterium sp. NPDC003449]